MKTSWNLQEIENHVATLYLLACSVKRLSFQVDLRCNANFSSFIHSFSTKYKTSPLQKSALIGFAAAAAKSLQSCPTLCDPIDSSPPGSTVAGILQARTLEWAAISFSNAWKWKVKGKSLSRVWLFATPWTAAHQAPPSMGFSRQEYWSGVPLPWEQNKNRCCPWPQASHLNSLKLSHPLCKMGLVFLISKSLQYFHVEN